jgi:hypothetical protein
MAGFETFDLGRVFATAEGIKGMKRQGETDRLRDLYLQQQTMNAQQSGQIQKQQADAETQTRQARSHYLAAQAVVNAPDPVTAARELAPEMIAAFEQQHGAGAFSKLPPDIVKQIATMGMEKSAAAAGISTRPDPSVLAQQQFLRESDQTNFNQEKQLTGIKHQNELSQIAATGEESRKTAEISAPGKALKGAQSLRKEFEGMESVKNYRAVQPIIQSAKKAPDNGYGDMDLIYAVGKILDPGSVVREGELALTIAAGSPLQRMLGTSRFSIEKGGRLTPKARQQIVGMLQGRVGALEDAYNQERARFSQYAAQNGFEPDQVVGAQQQDKPQGGADFIYVPGQGLQPAR